MANIKEDFSWGRSICGVFLDNLPSGMANGAVPGSGKKPQRLRATRMLFSGRLSLMKR